jgi:hypothetical protein
MDNIVINNSDIEEVIEDVLITEIVYTEEGKLKLSQEQIQQEIASLLGSKFFSFAKLAKKTSLYANLFESPVSNIPLIKTIYPIVDTVKFMLEDSFKPSFYYKIDPELDPDNNIKGNLFTDYIKVYSTINRSREEPYTHSSRSLYNHFKPYTLNESDTPLEEYARDAIWKHKDEIFRLIPKVEIDIGYRPDVVDAEYLKEFKCPQGRKYIERPQYTTIYEGDRPNVTGYVNIVKPRQNTIEFSLKKYKEMLKQLEVGTKVSVMFNTIVTDYHNKIIDEVSAHVTEIEDNTIFLDLDKNIEIEDEITKKLECPIGSYVPFFIYPTNFEPKYSKKQLMYQNYTFNFKNTTYIFPQTWTEYIAITSPKKIDYSTTEIDLLPYLKLKPRFSTITAPNAPAAFKRYERISDIFNFSKYEKFLKYKIPYLFEGKFIDSDISRLAYLRGKPDIGMLYILEHHQRKNIPVKELEAELQKLKTTLANFSQNVEGFKSPPRIVKHYTNLIDLNNDNEKDIYVDPIYDTTKYKLKEKTNLQGHELKLHLMRELEGDEFHVNSIIAGKTLVREGELAVLSFDKKHKKVYKRAIISRKPMWIKTGSDIPKCSEKPPSFEDLKKPNTMVLDTFDDLCKKVSQVKKNYEYMNLLTSISVIENLLKPVELNTELKEQISLVIQMQEGISELRRITNSMFGYVDKIAYDEFVGEEDFNNMFMNFDFDTSLTTMNQIKDKDVKERTILDIICKILEIDDLEDSTKKYINSYIDYKYPEESAQTQIKNKVTALNRQIDTLLRENKKKSPKIFKELKMKLEAKREEKIAEERVKILSMHNFDKISSCVAMLTLIIMAKYPQILINKLMPGCVKYFSYQAYPILKDEETTRSLTKYMGCVLKTLYQPKDIRFGMFNDFEMNTKMIGLKVKEILLEKYDLKTTLEKKEIKEEEKHDDETTYDVLNVFYRPNFNFSRKTYENNVIEYMRVINNIINKSKIMRYNIVNMPLIANTCCIELLIKNINFYKYLENQDSAFHNIQQKANSVKYYQKETISYFAKTGKYFEKEEFTAKKIEFEYPTSTIKIEEKELTLPEVDINAEQVHEDTLKHFAFISSKLVKNDKIKYVEKMIIHIENISNINNLRNIYIGYLRGYFRTVLSKFANLYIFKKNVKINMSDPFTMILTSLYDYETIKPILQRIANELEDFIKDIKFDSRSQDIRHDVTNIMIYSSLMCKFFLKMLWISTGVKKIPIGKESDILELSSALDLNKSKDITNKVVEIMQLLLENLADNITTNYFDITDLRKEVEILREKRKQEIMSKYSADDEERNQQKILKNMGLQVFDDIEEKTKIQLPEPINPPVEPEYETHEIQDLGENADEDVDDIGFY